MASDEGLCAVHELVLDQAKEREKANQANFSEIFNRLRAIEIKIAIGLGVIAALEFFSRFLPAMERLSK